MIPDRPAVRQSQAIDRRGTAVAVCWSGPGIPALPTGIAVRPRPDALPPMPPPDRPARLGPPLRRPGPVADRRRLRRGRGAGGRTARCWSPRRRACRTPCRRSPRRSTGRPAARVETELRLVGPARDADRAGGAVRPLPGGRPLFVDRLVEAGAIDAGDGPRLRPWPARAGPTRRAPRGRSTGLDDLTRAEVRAVAIAEPEFAPYGRAARQALEAAGLWDALQPKLVRGRSVRQALQYVETGDADAALVAESIAGSSGPAERADRPGSLRADRPAARGRRRLAEGGGGPRPSPTS